MIKIIIIKEINFNVKRFTGIWSSLVMWSNHKGLFRRFDHAPTKVHVCGGQILGCVNFKSTFMYIYDEYMVLGKLFSLMFIFYSKNHIFMSDWERCKCEAESRRPPVCNVWQNQRRGNCRRNAGVLGDCWLLNQRGNGRLLHVLRIQSIPGSVCRIRRSNPREI